MSLVLSEQLHVMERIDPSLWEFGKQMRDRAEWYNESEEKDSALCSAGS